MKQRRGGGYGGKRAGWSQVPSSSELAALVRCERELVLTREYGERSSASRRAASERGMVFHAQAQEEMERHHNAPRQRPNRTHGTPPYPAGPRRTTDRRCFIATAVYGDDAEQTWELRLFRDTVLAPCRWGRSAIWVYYALSPSLVRWLLRHPVALPWVRGVLDMVRRALGTGRPDGNRGDAYRRMWAMGYYPWRSDGVSGTAVAGRVGEAGKDGPVGQEGVA